MDIGSSQPLNKPESDGLFQIEDSVTVVKSVETSMQRQRREDGTPYTVGGATALRPLGPKLVLNSLSKSYSLNAEEKDSDKHCDPDEVLKAYMAKND